MPCIRSTFRAGPGADLRYVVRRLLRNPGFSLVAVLSLAVGIGANAAVASVARAALFEVLPVERPDELWFLFWGPPIEALDGMFVDDAVDASSGRRIGSNVTLPGYEQVRRTAASGVSMGAFTFVARTNVVFGTGPTESAAGVLADSDFFATLRPPMALGRAFVAADDAPGAEPVAVIGYDFWQRAAGGSPSVVDETVRVNGTAVRVVGVTAPGFKGLSPGGFRPSTDITLPLSLQPVLAPHFGPAGGSLLTSPTMRWIRGLVRLPRDASTAAFEARATAGLRASVMDAGLADAATAATVTAVLRPARRGIDLDEASTTASVRILGAIVAGILLVACLNLAGLMLARGVSRHREFAVRAALGASRWQIVRLALLESAVASSAGAVLALALLVAGRPVIASMSLRGIGPNLGEVSIDGVAFSVAAAAAFASAIAAALLPAWQWSGLQLGEGLSQRQGGVAPRQMLARVLVVAQVAMSVPVLCGCGLLLRTLYNLTHVDLGFSPASLVTFRVEAPRVGAEEPQGSAYGRVLRSLEGVDGLGKATMAENPLIAGVMSSRAALVDDQRVFLHVNGVGPAFFDTLGMAVLAGRPLDESDAIGPESVVINETAARLLFGGPAVGRHFVIPAPPGMIGDRDVEVVGVVADSKYTSLRVEAPPTLFDWYGRRPANTLVGMTFMVRVDGPPGAFERSIRDAVAGAAPGIAVTSYQTQSAQIARTIGRERVFAELLTIFGAFALALAAMGLYGSTAYTVARRTNEIGVRLALGARRGQVRLLVLRQVALLGGAGLLLGVPTALATNRFLQSLVFGLPAQDPATIATAGVVMLGVVLLAGWGPSRRASLLDPITAIRCD